MAVSERYKGVYAPGALGVEEEHEVDEVAVFVLQLQHVLWRHRDRHSVMEITCLRHLGVDDLKQQQDVIQCCLVLGILVTVTLSQIDGLRGHIREIKNLLRFFFSGGGGGLTHVKIYAITNGSTFFAPMVYFKVVSLSRGPAN